MKKNLILSVLVLFLVAFGFSSAHASVFSEVQAVVPHTAIQKVIKTPIEGLYGAILASGQVIYIYPKTGIIVFGNLYTHTGVNLTQNVLAKVQNEAAKSILSTVNYKYAVKIGDGPIKVVEFANLDCPFCRMAEKLFETDKRLRSKVTRYIFLIPQPSIHPHSMEITQYFFSQPKSERAKLLSEIMVGLKIKGNIPPKFTPTKSALKHINYNMSFAFSHHIYGVPYFIINRKAVEGVNIKEIFNLVGIKTVDINKLNSTLYKR